MILRQTSHTTAVFRQQLTPHGIPPTSHTTAPTPLRQHHCANSNFPYIRCAHRMFPISDVHTELSRIHHVPHTSRLFTASGRKFCTSAKVTECMRAARPKTTRRILCYIQLTDIRMAIDLELRKQTQWDAAIQQIFVEAGRMVVQMGLGKQMGLGNGFGASGFGTSGALHPPMPSLMAWTHRLLVTLQLTSGRYHRQLAIAALYRYCFSCDPPRCLPMLTCGCRCSRVTCGI